MSIKQSPHWKNKWVEMTHNQWVVLPEIQTTHFLGRNNRAVDGHLPTWVILRKH